MPIVTKRVKFCSLLHPRLSVKVFFIKLAILVKYFANISQTEGNGIKMVMQENQGTKNDLETEKPTKKRKLSSASEEGSVAKATKTEAEQSPSKEAASEENKKNSKRHKKRKKNYFNTIRAQMEFYFGDANLSKDRFLKKLITQDPYVPLEVFMTFNKMKTICKSVEEIAKSLSNSQLLELDESGMKVRRKTNLPEERNVDAKTLYVESLPAIATHDWVREIFERFGPVTYVSLPKYTKSRKIKEFGFVEFENEDSIQKAVESFQKFNGVLNTAETDPAELTSVKSFVQEQNEEIKQEKVEDSAKVETSKKNSDDEEDGNENDVKQKRKKCKSANKELEPLTKRIKKEETESETESAINTQSSVAGSGTDTDVKVESDNVDKQKKKKHKKKVKSLKERKRDTELIAEAAYFELKILPKRDWKRLRNKYLNLQRQRVGELKRKAWRERQEQQQQQQQTSETVDDEYADNETKKCSKSTLKTGMNMNFYGAGDDEAIQKTLKQNAALEKPPLFSYEPGLIVEVSLQEPCINLKEFKANMRQYPAVKYVDIKEGAILAHLRLESGAAAVEFVQRMNSADHGCKVLSGDLEKTYWQKIEKDREAKLNKQVNSSHREKVLTVLRRLLYGATNLIWFNCKLCNKL